MVASGNDTYSDCFNVEDNPFPNASPEQCVDIIKGIVKECSKKNPDILSIRIAQLEKTNFRGYIKVREAGII